MTDEEYRFDPPLDVYELVAAAEPEEWAVAATAMVARMLRLASFDEREEVPEELLVVHDTRAPSGGVSASEVLVIRDSGRSPEVAGRTQAPGGWHASPVVHGPR